MIDISHTTLRRAFYNELPISLVYRSLNRKLYREQHCIECGHPLMNISDKYVAIIDGNIPVDLLREHERVLEARCRHSICRQYYRIEV